MPFRKAEVELLLDVDVRSYDLASAAQEQSRGLAILIDEAQDLTRGELKALCAICHQGGQFNWPFIVALAGPPSLPTVLLKTKSDAERLFNYWDITGTSQTFNIRERRPSALCPHGVA